MANDERSVVTATLGPWRGYVLTLPADQAARAIADGWAVAQAEPPYDLAMLPHDFPELSEAERVAAEAAARAWVNAQQPTRF